MFQREILQQASSTFIMFIFAAYANHDGRLGTPSNFHPSVNYLHGYTPFNFLTGLDYPEEYNSTVFKPQKYAATDFKTVIGYNKERNTAEGRENAPPGSYQCNVRDT